MPTWGRWTVVKEDGDPQYPWVCMIWGGTGEHWLDYTTYPTWPEAMAAAVKGATETPDPENGGWLVPEGVGIDGFLPVMVEPPC